MLRVQTALTLLPLQTLEEKLSLGHLRYHYYHRSANVEQRFIYHSLDPPRVRSPGAPPSPVLTGIA